MWYIKVVDDLKRRNQFEEMFFIGNYFPKTVSKNPNKRQWSGQVFRHLSAGIFNSSFFIFHLFLLLLLLLWFLIKMKKRWLLFFGVSISTILKCHKDGKIWRHSRERIFHVVSDSGSVSFSYFFPLFSIVRVLFSFSCHARGLEEVDADSSVMGDSQWMSVSTPSLWAFKKNQEN